MRIHVHVGTILLHGIPVPPHGAPAIGSAVEVELTRLLQVGGLAAELRQGGRISGAPKASFQLSMTSSPTTLGLEIGRSVFGTIGKSPRSKIKSAPHVRRGSSAAAGAKK